MFARNYGVYFLPVLFMHALENWSLNPLVMNYVLVLNWHFWRHLLHGHENVQKEANFGQFCIVVMDTPFRAALFMFEVENLKIFIYVAILIVQSKM